MQIELHMTLNVHVFLYTFIPSPSLSVPLVTLKSGARDPPPACGPAAGGGQPAQGPGEDHEAAGTHPAAGDQQRQEVWWRGGRKCGGREGGSVVEGGGVVGREEVWWRGGRKCGGGEGGSVVGREEVWWKGGGEVW